MPNPPTKRAPRCSPAHGRCPECKTPLQLWSAAVAVTVERDPVYRVYGCTMCEADKVQVHYYACLCGDCRKGVDKRHVI